MEAELRESVTRALFRFKRMMSLLHMDNDLHMNEMAVMRKLWKMETGGDVMTGLHHDLFITRPAVSQILSGLERKGFITRDIDENDRRRICVKLTPDGRAAFRHLSHHDDDMIARIVARFGEDDLRQLALLMERFADTVETVKKESKPEGKNPIC